MEEGWGGGVAFFIPASMANFAAIILPSLLFLRQLVDGLKCQNKSFNAIVYKILSESLHCSLHYSITTRKPPPYTSFIKGV